jgi:hypothetical protein
MSVTKNGGGALQAAGGPTSGPGSIVQEPYSANEATPLLRMNVVDRRTFRRSISEVW